MQDDLEQLLGIRSTPEQALALKELARRANDRLRVFNPTTADYSVAWALHDEITPGGYFTVPSKNVDMGYGKGQSVVLRYIAFKFFKEITNLILDGERKMAVDTENDRREKAGMKPMDKTFETGEELAWIYKKGVNIDRPDKLMELLPKIILGVEQEWGMDTIRYAPHEDAINWSKVMDIVNRPVANNTSGISQEIEAKEPAKLSDKKAM